MTLSIDYNCPMDQKSATVNLGLFTNEDVNFMFRIGVIEKSNINEVRWVIPGWMTIEQVRTAKVVITRDNVLMLEKMEISTNSTVGRNKIDIGVEWPFEATGSSITNVSYIIF